MVSFVCQHICLILGQKNIVTFRRPCLTRHYPWLASGFLDLNWGDMYFGLGIGIGLGRLTSSRAHALCLNLGQYAMSCDGAKGQLARNSACRIQRHGHKFNANVSSVWQIFPTNSLKCSFDTVSTLPPQRLPPALSMVFLAIPIIYMITLFRDSRRDATRVDGSARICHCTRLRIGRQSENHWKASKLANLK